MSLCPCRAKWGRDWVEQTRGRKRHAARLPQRQLSACALQRDIQGGIIGEDRHAAGSRSGRIGAVVDRPGDRAAWMGDAWRGKGDRVEFRLIGGLARRAVERQHSCARTVAAGNAALGRPDAQCIAREESRADADCGRNQGCRLQIVDRQSGI